MATHERAKPADSRGSSRGAQPGSAPAWHVVVELVRAFGVRPAVGALLIAVAAAIFGWSGDAEPTSTDALATSAAAEDEAAPEPKRVPTGTAAMRIALARLPGTGTAGVYRFLGRYGLLADVTEERAAEFVAEMHRVLEDADPSQRLGAARVLIALGSGAGARDLVALSEDDEEEVRLTALAGLGRIRGDGAVLARNRLQEVCADDGRTRPERFHALQSLSRLDRAVDVDALAGVAAGENDPILRLMAARTLLAHRDRRAVPVLLDLLHPAGGGRTTPEDLEFVRREANDTLRAVTPAEPDEESPEGWREVAPKIERAMATAGFSYAPRTLRLR